MDCPKLIFKRINVGEYGLWVCDLSANANLAEFWLITAAPAEGGWHLTVVRHLEWISKEGAVIRSALEAITVFAISHYRTLEQRADEPIPRWKIQNIFFALEKFASSPQLWMWVRATGQQWSRSYLRERFLRPQDNHKTLRKPCLPYKR